MANKKAQNYSCYNLIKEHIQFCFGIASVHGLYHIVAKNRNPVERLMWLTIVVGSAIFGILQGLQVWEHYLINPSILNFERDYQNWKVEFPSITICEFGFVPNVKKVFLNITENKISWNKSVENYLKDLAFNDFDSYYTLKEYANGEKPEYLEPSQYRNVLNQIIPLMVGNKGTDKRKWKHKYPLNKENTPFIRTFSEVGVCSTFNPNALYYFSPEFISSNNVSFVYEKILYGPSDEVIFSTRSINNMYTVLICSPYEIIDILSEELSNEDLTFQTVKYVSDTVVSTQSFLKLSRQQRNCRQIDEAEDLLHSPIYTKNLCMVECRINLCLKFCDCIPYYYRNVNQDEKICNLSGLYCLSKYSEDIVTLRDIHGNSLCDCVMNCDFTFYTIEYSNSISWFLDTNLEIQSARFPIIRYKWNVVFSRMDVLSQVGGILGLFLGCSSLSIIEFIYFFTFRFFWGVIMGRSITI